MSKKLMNELIRIVGKKGVSNDKAERFSYAFDFSVHKYMPDVVVLPKNAKEVSKVLKLANKMSIPVIPRGGGTGTVGGALALNGGIVLDISGMDKIKDIDKGNLSMTCEGGVTIDRINKELHKEGLFFPMQMDGLAGIIGGYIACNGTGEHSVKFGKMRDWTRSLEVVLPNGEILRTGSAAPVSTNPDLTHLFVGTEGVMGVITEATFGILPLPEKKVVGLVSVGDLDTAGNILSRILKEGPVADLMVYDELSLKGMREKLAHPGANAFLKVTLIGRREEVERLQKDIGGIISGFNNVLKMRWVDSKKTPVQTNPLIDNAQVEPGARPVHIAEDIAFPVSKLAPALLGIKKISRIHSVLIMVISGDVGRGVLHPQLFMDVTDRRSFAKARKVVNELYRLAIDLGGAISGTHGVGISRAHYMALEHKEPYLKTLGSIKRALDAKNILNPGKMGLSPVPDSFANILFREWWDCPESDSSLEEYRQALITCDFCGFCNIVCPTFLKEKWHSSSPRGRLLLARGLLTGEIEVTDKLKGSILSCSHCYACNRNCPKGLPITEIIERCREVIYRNRKPDACFG